MKWFTGLRISIGSVYPDLQQNWFKTDRDAIVAPATINAVALKQATDKIPIVVAALGDPELLGFTANDARPTGNVRE